LDSQQWSQRGYLPFLKLFLLVIKPILWTVQPKLLSDSANKHFKNLVDATVTAAGIENGSNLNERLNGKLAMIVSCVLLLLG
jgi:hypothetical protein